MSVGHITRQLEYCLRSTYFVFQGKYYEQLEGAAMGSPLSPIIANFYMEEFETKALSIAPNPQLGGKGLLMTPLLSLKAWSSAKL